MASNVKPEMGKMFYHGMDAESLKRGFLDHLEFSLAEDPRYTSSDWDHYVSLALAIRWEWGFNRLRPVGLLRCLARPVGHFYGCATRTLP